jgi:hypothetical protein
MGQLTILEQLNAENTELKKIIKDLKKTNQNLRLQNAEMYGRCEALQAVLENFLKNSKNNT